MKFILLTITTLLLGGCLGNSYSTKSVSGRLMAVTHQASLTSAPGITWAEYCDPGGKWSEPVAYPGSTIFGEVFGGAAVGTGLAVQEGDSVSVSGNHHLRHHFGHRPPRSPHPVPVP